MTHLRLCTLAAALLAVTSAQALTPAEIVVRRGNGQLVEVDLAGPASLGSLVATAIFQHCQPNTVDVMWSLDDEPLRAYSCYLDRNLGSYPGGTPLVVHFRNQSNFAGNVRNLANSTQLASMAIDDSCIANDAEPVTPRANIYGARWLCSGLRYRVTAIGLSEVEPALLNFGLNLNGTAVALSDLVISPLAQGIFGVVANTNLRNALQAAQGLTVGAEDEANQPSIPYGFAVSAFAGKINVAAGLGWQQLGLTGADATKKVNVARRTVGSGTQAASNAYFLNGNCGPGGQSAAGSQTSTTTQVSANQDITSYSSSSTLVYSFATANETGKFQLAVLGRENSPTPTGTTTDNGYRFVKLNGVAPTRANARVGLYDFVFESTIQWRAADDAGNVGALGRALASSLPTAALLAAADSDVQKGLLAPPRTWTAGNATDIARIFNSRVSREVNKSCTPLVYAK